MNVSQPRYFEPLEIPYYTYIWDAVMWVGFGRFPEDTAYMVTDGFPSEFDDYGSKLGTLSFNYKDPLFRQDYQFLGFCGAEAHAAGLTEQSTDWVRYDDILRHHGYIRPELLRDEIDRLRLLPEPPPGEEDHPYAAVAKLTAAFNDGVYNERLDRPYYLESLEKRLAETPFLDGVHRLLKHHIDRAWSKIFESVVDGKIRGLRVA